MAVAAGAAVRRLQPPRSPIRRAATGWRRVARWSCRRCCGSPRCRRRSTDRCPSATAITSSPENAGDARALGVVDVPDIGDLRAALLARGDQIAAQGIVGFAAIGQERQVAVLAGGNQGSGHLLGDFGRGADDRGDRDLGRAAEPTAWRRSRCRRCSAPPGPPPQPANEASAQGGERYRCDAPEPAAHVTCVRAQQNSPSVGRTAPLATDLS